MSNNSGTPISLPIVGAKFRPPASGLLSVLRAGNKLLIRREPDNQYDANALQVLIVRDELEKLPEAQLQSACEGFGFGSAEVLAAPEWHLGYIPRGDAEMLAPSFDRAATRGISASLTFDFRGRPAVSFAVP